MLHEFLAQNFDQLVSRAKANASARPWPSTHLESGTELLLAQLRDALRGELRRCPSPTGGSAPPRPGTRAPSWRRAGPSRRSSTTTVPSASRSRSSPSRRDRRSAWRSSAPLNRCLDAAIAQGVTEYARLKDEATSHREVERLAQVGHDLRTELQTALLSFRALKTGKAAIDGSAGDALGRSLVHLRDLIDTSLSEGRLAATSRVSLAAFVHEVAVAAHPDAEHREIRLTIEPGDPALAVDVDPQLLASALMNLLQNAFKYTRAHGCVTLRARSENGRALVEVEDECGGMLTSEGAPHRALGDRRGSDRSAPGRGLSSSRRTVQANGGEIHARNLPGKGCVFGIQLPVAAPLEGGA